MQNRNSYRKVDIAGQRFGNLVALRRVEGKRTQWLFQCDCGNTVELAYSRVLYGQMSCGCLRKETAQEWVKSHITHGESKTKLYRKYRSILERCYRKDTWKYKRYGGRGIYVCDEWKNSFQAFRDWAYKTGYDPSLDGRTEQSIDRIDNNGPYSPENCRWTTAAEQQKNREVTTLYPYHGEMYSASEFADKFGISDKSFVYRRLKIKHQTLEYILNDWERAHNIPDGLIYAGDYAKKKNVTLTCVIRWLNAGKISGEKRGRKWYVHDNNL